MALACHNFRSKFETFEIKTFTIFQFNIQIWNLKYGAFSCNTHVTNILIHHSAVAISSTLF